MKNLNKIHIFFYAMITSFFLFNTGFTADLKKSTPLTASAVAVADKYGAEAAEEIFKKGGNAVDAAVAIAFTLAVTYPEAGNIGGGGFMTLYINHTPYFLDYRESAPLLADKDMYLDKNKDVIKNLSLYGAKAVGVPGTVAGLWAVHQRFGKLSWQAVLAPAIRFAEQGFIVSDKLATAYQTSVKHFSQTNFNQFFKNLKKGANFKQPELAETLRRIAANGQKEFYEGKTADLIVSTMQTTQGLIRKQDLKNYKAIWRDPIIAKWQGYEIITAPPPSSGGIGLIQLLKMKEVQESNFNNIALNSPQYIHLLAEIEKRVFADRAQYLGDPDFYKVPTKQLIEHSYIVRRAKEINLQNPSTLETVKPGLGNYTLQKNSTTHFSVVDHWGNAVANTYTLNGNFGSGVVVKGAGFLLNNEMDDFSVKPGVANMFGVVGSDANAISPKKRPLSSMTPTILIKNSKVALVIGTPGGSRIFTSIFQVINNIYDYHLSLNEAVAVLRFHHQLIPNNTIFIEPYKPIPEDLTQALIKRGYTLEKQDFNGDIQVILIQDRTPTAVSDPRGRGTAKIIPSPS